MVCIFSIDVADSKMLSGDWSAHKGALLKFWCFTQALCIDWKKLHWTLELLNDFWVWSWFGEWKMDVTSVLKTLPEVMTLIPGCAGTVVSSTSLLAGLLHKEWTGVLGGSWLCAALQLFIHIFLNGWSEFLRAIWCKEEMLSWRN